MIQLLTLQYTYSHAHEGSWSWFEVGIMPRQKSSPSTVDVPPEQPPPAPVESSEWGLHWRRDVHPLSHKSIPERNPKTGQLLCWKSHHNDIAGQTYTVYLGPLFGPRHEIWEHLKEGDRLGVWMCAERRGWECWARSAEIDIWERFKPIVL